MDAGTALQMPQSDAPMIRQQEQQTLAPMYGELDQMQAQRSATPAPKLQQAPEKPEQGQPGVEWIAAINGLAALAGAKARDGATTALKSFAGGLQGLQKANVQQFTQQHDEWKEASKNVSDLNKEQLSEYKTVMDSQNKSVSEKEAEIRSIAMQYQNNVMASARDFATQMRLYDMQVKAGEKADEEFKKANNPAEKAKEALRDLTTARQTWDAMYPKNMVGMRPSGTPDLKKFLSTEWPSLKGTEGASPVSDSDLTAPQAKGGKIPSPPGRGVPPNLPDAKGLAEGSSAKDKSGKVVAVVKNGVWTSP